MSHNFTHTTKMIINLHRQLWQVPSGEVYAVYIIWPDGWVARERERELSIKSLNTCGHGIPGPSVSGNVLQRGLQYLRFDILFVTIAANVVSIGRQLSATIGVTVGVTATTARSWSRPSADVRSKRRAKVIRPGEIAYNKREKPQNKT